jgi:RNA polymerase sigma-70 factor, ECF subfamily
MASLNTFEIDPVPVRAVARDSGRKPMRMARMVRNARNGDRESFDALVDGHRDGLRSFLQNRVEEAEIEDVLQEVFFAAWRAIPNYDGRSQFRTWLFAIAFNKVRDHYRARHRRISEVQENESAEGLAAGPDPYARTDLSLSVREMLNTLSESQREVLLFYYQDCLTLAEIASVLNRNLSTVKYQFFQAHSRLADQMRQSPDWSAMSPRAKEVSK